MSTHHTDTTATTPAQPQPVRTPEAMRGEYVSETDSQGRPIHDRFGRVYSYGWSPRRPLPHNSRFD